MLTQHVSSLPACGKQSHSAPFRMYVVAACVMCASPRSIAATAPLVRSLSRPADCQLSPHDTARSAGRCTSTAHGSINNHVQDLVHTDMGEPHGNQHHRDIQDTVIPSSSSGFHRSHVASCCHSGPSEQLSPRFTVSVCGSCLSVGFLVFPVFAHW